MTTAKFSDVLEAYEFCAFGDLVDTQAFVSLERGTVHVVCGDMELDEETPEDIDFGPYIALPGKAELGLGRDIVIEFAEAQLPEDVQTIAALFRKRSAYSNFKGLLAQKGKLQTWFDYEKSVKESRLREWCANHGIELL